MVVPLERGFVQAAAEIAREVGALFWVDEVQTGVGRTGTFFAYEQLGVEPGLVTLAKGLGNGLPVGALLVRAGAAEAVGPGDHGATFGGNPVACAAACAVVEAVDDALLANVVERGEQLVDGLSGLPGAAEVRGRGLMVAAVLDREVAQVVDACREAGLLVLTAGPPPGVLRLLPPLAKLVQSRNRQIAQASLLAIRRFLSDVLMSPVGLAAVNSEPAAGLDSSRARSV